MAHSVTHNTTRLTAGGSDLLSHIDLLRLDACRILDEAHRASMGQFFTPAPVAELMASMLACPGPAVHILDAGAGVGALFAACVSMLCSRPDPPQQVSVTAYELDDRLLNYLQETLQLCRRPWSAESESRKSSAREYWLRGDLPFARRPERAY